MNDIPSFSDLCLFFIAVACVSISISVYGMYRLFKLDHDEYDNDMVQLLETKHFCPDCFCDKCLESRKVESDELRN